jgi:uncharacterized protein (DUF2141 family)
MKTLKRTIATASFFIACFSPTVFAAELIAVVDNIKDIKGSLINVDKNTLTIAFGDLPAGNYAIKCYQDVNNNGKIDLSGMGIPEEPFGSSGKSTFFGPPSYSDAMFLLDSNKTLKIHLK